MEEGWNRREKITIKSPASLRLMENFIFCAVINSDEMNM